MKIISRESNILLILFLATLSNCNSVKEIYTKREIKEIPDFIQTLNESDEREKILEKEDFIDATDYLPKGFLKDASKDYTEFIQFALDENNYVKLPNFPLLINDKGIDIKSNKILVFDKKTILVLQPSAKTNYEILRIHKQKNIIVFSPKIEGDKYNHLNKKGEWGMGISIISSKDVKIINPIIERCWGDGIYLGQSGNETCKNITIEYGLLNDNRRNGISIISADGLKIQNLIVSNTKGTNPQAGIDFEPNRNNEKLKNIELRNIYTYKNKNQGMFFVFGALKETKDSISISVNNFISNHSKKSIGFHNMNNAGIKGNIEIINFKSKNSTNPIYYFKNSLKDHLNIKIE